MATSSTACLILDVLPAELVVDIFKLCLPKSRFITPRPDTAPLLLGQICSQWRKLSISTPDLWNCLRIPDGRKLEEFYSLIEMVETWLSRSGECPLSIWCPSIPFDHPPIYNRLLSTCNRWKDIRIDILPQTSPLPLDSQFPMLESLEILTPQGLPSPHPFDTVNPFSASPNLRKLVWIDPMKCEYEGEIHFRWEQLTHLTISVEMPLAGCLHILSKSTSLVQAAFQNINMRSFGNANPNLAPMAIYLPHLETFSLLSAASFQPLLDRVKAPKLKELILNLLCGRQQWPWPTDSFLAFLDRSHCPIETLSLYFNNIQPSDLISILQPIQSTLKALTLQGSRSLFTDDLAERLTNKGDSQIPLCPKLEFLGLFDCIDCSPENLGAVVRSRSADSPFPPNDPAYVARLKVVECFEKDAANVATGLGRLDESPILLRYDRGSVHAAGLNPKESSKLKKFKQDGLHLPRYSAMTGQLGPIDDWYLG